MRLRKSIDNKHVTYPDVRSHAYCVLTAIIYAQWLLKYIFRVFSWHVELLIIAIFKNKKKILKEGISNRDKTNRTRIKKKK